MWWNYIHRTCCCFPTASTFVCRKPTMKVNLVTCVPDTSEELVQERSRYLRESISKHFGVHHRWYTRSVYRFRKNALLHLQRDWVGQRYLFSSQLDRSTQKRSTSPSFSFSTFHVQLWQMYKCIGPDNALSRALSKVYITNSYKSGAALKCFSGSLFIRQRTATNWDAVAGPSVVCNRRTISTHTQVSVWGGSVPAVPTRT